MGRRPARSATPPGVRRRPAGGSSCGHILARFRRAQAPRGCVRCAQTSRFGDRRSSRRTADRCAAQGGSEGCERGRGSGAHRPAPGAAVTSRRVGCLRLERRGVPLCCAADSPSSEPARGGEPRPVSLVRWRRQLASAGSGCGHHVDEGGLSATRVARGLRCAAQALLPIQRLAFGASRGRRR